jgi:hypothetical protein
MGGGVSYLVHFPDGSDRVRTVSLPYVASRGTELLSGWIVEEIAVRDNDEVPYEAWVVADQRGDDFVAHGREVARKSSENLSQQELVDAALKGTRSGP